MVKEENWMEKLVEFYDFVWSEGVSAHGSCINNELLEDFKEGGDKFQQMIKLIVKKFPTEEDARKAFNPPLEPKP